jgi:hypothetical protein
MRERLDILRLAGQLQQQGPFHVETLAAFIKQHHLTSDEVSVLKAELITNLVTTFSLVGVSAKLPEKKMIRPVSKFALVTYREVPEPPATELRIPTILAMSRETLGGVAERNGGQLVYYLANNPVAYRLLKMEDDVLTLYPKDSVLPPATNSIEASTSRVYAFPYDPQASKQVIEGASIRYYYPSGGHDPIHVDQVAYVDRTMGILQLSNSKLIPLTYVTGIFGQV